jgi:Ca-activated chloride channel family protein
MRMLVGQLSENDRVAIVVYAGASGLVLPSVTGDQKDTILSAIDRLSAGGSTNGAAGIELAYEIAAGHFIKGGTNRVILATDGDFNVGVTDRGALVQLVEEKAKHGVFLTALGFGMGNLKDATLEQLADKGNGNYAYIDGEREARKVFVEQMAGTLVTIAKDVKLQLEFNPAQVASYRLIGYENRALRNEDFNNDKKDAGDIGAGHTVTALYELTPTAAVPANATPAAVDALKYQRPASLAEAAQNGELLTLKLRYKQPDADQSQLIEHPVKDGGKIYAQASADFKFASAVALFGMLLRQSPYHGQASFDTVLELAKEAIAAGPSVAEQQRKEAAGVKEEVVGDANGYRGEFIQLVEIAKSLQPAAAK